MLRKGRVFLTSYLAGVVLSIFMIVVLLGAAFAAYAEIAQTLPPIERLEKEATGAVTTRIYDRNGVLLNEVFNPDEGRHTLVRLEDISPFLIEAVIATEDANFYKHPGFDPIAIARAVYLAWKNKEFVSGGSTIVQQLVKITLLSPERTFSRKVREIILAAEVNRKYDKDTILEMYLNRVYFGRSAYGAEAAAQIFFGKSAKDLTLGQASLLAGLIQAPSLYDPYTNPKAARERQRVVLNLMVKNGFITRAQADAALQEPWNLVPPRVAFEAPHFVLYVRQQLEKLYGPELVYRGGLQVYTTLDLNLQREVERIARAHVARLQGRNVNNAAVVVIRPGTGEILAMMGSLDYNNTEIDGQINMALIPRQPGSSIKPLTYLAAFEMPPPTPEEMKNLPHPVLPPGGWNPATLIPDIKTEFPDPSGPYVPVNYDRREHGLVTVRAALANSYNIPAVYALQHVGIERLKDIAKRLGITTLTRDDYGLSLTLGGGEVTLLEMTNAYATLANQGQYVPPTAIVCVRDVKGDLIQVFVEDTDVAACQPGAGAPSVTWAGRLMAAARPVQAVDPRYVYQITSILSDNEARLPAFGPNNPLQLDRPAAAKTGTTNDFRDGWTLGYTPDIAVGVWVGNADYSPMIDVPGSLGAAPIWNGVMKAALRDVPPKDFPVPAGVSFYEICKDTGTRPSEACPERRQEVFVPPQEPFPAEFDLHQKVRIDKVNGKRAPEECPEHLVEEKDFLVYPEPYREWAEKRNIPQPPAEVSDTCFKPQVNIVLPKEGDRLWGEIVIVGTVKVPYMVGYRLLYGETHEPQAFGTITGFRRRPLENKPLARWDTSNLKEGPYTIRLEVVDETGYTYTFDTRIWLQCASVACYTPTPTPTPTVTPTPTQTPTMTPTATATPTPTATFTPTPTPTLPTKPTPVPTPTPTATPTPSATPSPAATVSPTPVTSPTRPPTPTPASRGDQTPTPTATGTPTRPPTPTPTPTPTPST